MSNPIVKLEGKYLIWSSIVDAPITMGMTRQELEEYVKDWYGKQGLFDLPARLERVEATGTSLIGGGSAEETIWVNRAGAGETSLGRAQFIDHFIRNQDETKPLPVGLASQENETFEEWSRR